MTSYKSDALKFAETLKAIKLKNNTVRFGSFALKGKKGVKDSINNQQDGINFLGDRHEYSFKIRKGTLQLSMQLYLNSSDHYRLFAFTKFDEDQGMTFSINLTTQKETKDEDIIWLTQKIRFSEQYDGDKNISKAHRQQKQIVMCEILKKLGLEVPDNNDLILGIFDPNKKEFANTTAEKFLK